MSGERILIIDDSDNIRTTLKLTLEFKGYEVDEAGSGHEGLEALRNTSYDLVFCDLAMPGMNGEEVIRKVREELELPDLPIIVLSAEEREAKDNALAAGATEYLDKPFSPNEIFEAVERGLNP